MEEKEHDNEMSVRNLQQLKEMLEEKSQNSESNQEERLKNIAGWCSGVSHFKVAFKLHKMMS